MSRGVKVSMLSNKDEHNIWQQVYLQLLYWDRGSFRDVRQKPGSPTLPSRSGVFLGLLPHLLLHLPLQPRHPLSLPLQLLLQLLQLRVVLQTHRSNLSAEQALSAAQVVVWSAWTRGGAWSLYWPTISSEGWNFCLCWNYPCSVESASFNCLLPNVLTSVET